MSILKWFNKPKWQNSNIQVRITAIRNSQDPELIHQLPHIIQYDPSEQVQMAALGQLTDVEALIEVANSHDNKKLRQAAAKKLINRCTQDDDEQLIKVVNQVKEHGVAQALAESAKNSRLRLAAIDQLTQQGLLAELLLKENDPTVQQHILNRISQQKTLLRLQEQTQKKNPALSELIGRKIKPDAQANHNDEALQLCQQLEAVVHGKSREAIELDHIEKQWQAIKATVDQGLVNRFNGAFEAARMILDPEHRNEFLEKQKQQRAITDLTETEHWLKANSSASIGTLQATISRLQEHDIKLLSAAEQQRLAAVMTGLTDMQDAVQKAQQVPDKVLHVVDQLKAVLNQQTVAPQQLKQFKQQWQKATQKASDSDAMSDLHAQFKQLCLQLADKIEQSADLRDRSAQQAVDLVDKAVSEIEEGHLVNAKKVINQIAELKKLAGHNHPVIKRHKYQLDQVWNRLKELRKWQKWSNDKVRQDIIQGIVDIHGQGLHPDAVLKKLKDSNEQWYALEDMEKLPGDKYPSRNHTLWQQFREVSKAVFEPTQPYFEKRGEQQDARLDDYNSLIRQMNDTDLSETNEQELASLSRRAIGYLKSLDQLPPKKRGATAKKLRKGLNRIDARLNEFYSQAEQQKLKLIEAAEQLQEVDNLADAIEQAKALQSRWKNAGMVKQYTERKLWKRFRKANDAVFNRRNEEKKAHNEVLKQQQQAVKSLVKSQQQAIRQLHNPEGLKNQKGLLNQAWDELDIPSGFLAGELSQLMQLIDDKLKSLSQQELIKSLDQKQQLDELYTQWELAQLSEQDLQHKLDQAGLQVDADWHAQRLQSNTGDDNHERLNELLIASEFLTGLTTPAEHMEQRMAYQVKVLSERMSGEKNLQDHQQAKELVNAWQSTAKTDADFLSANKQRINKALKALRSLILE